MKPHKDHPENPVHPDDQFPMSLSALILGPHEPNGENMARMPLEETTATIEDTLAERRTRYGAFVEHARITQALKRAMQDSPNWATLADDQKEALEMLQHKIGRILNGDPDYHDSWHDIIGYTKLVADRLERGVTT